MANQTYAMGVGDIYIYVGSTIPEDSLLEAEGNKIGSTSGGCTLTYSFDSYPIEDDAFKKLATIKTGETVGFKGNILTWDLDLLAKLTAGATVVTDEDTDVVTMKLGGGATTIQNIVVRFVHTFSDGRKLKATMVGNSTGGFELAFAKDAETIIPFEITAISQSDGTLCTLDIVPAPSV